MAKKKVTSISCDVPYPISRFDLLNQYGNCKVEFDNGDIAYIHNLLGDVDIEEFNSKGELIGALKALVM